MVAVKPACMHAYCLQSAHVHKHPIVEALERNSLQEYELLNYEAMPRM